MASSVSFCYQFGVVRLERLQTMVHEYWRVTVAVLLTGSTIVLVSTPSNSSNPHSQVASLLDFFGALGSLVVASPVQTFAVLALGVSTSYILTAAQSQPTKHAHGGNEPKPSFGNEKKLFSIPILCQLGSHDIHVEADCSSPMSASAQRFHSTQIEVQFKQAGSLEDGLGNTLALKPLRTSFLPRLSFEARDFSRVFSTSVSASAPTTPSYPSLLSPFAPRQPSTPTPATPPRPATFHPLITVSSCTQQHSSLDSPRSLADEPTTPTHTTPRSGSSLDEARPPPRWRPSMQRIESGQDLLALVAPTEGPRPTAQRALCLTAAVAEAPAGGALRKPCTQSETATDAACGVPPDPLAYLHPTAHPCAPGEDAVAAASAVSAAGAAADCACDVHTVVTDSHLMQLAAALGEPAALQALQAGSFPAPVGGGPGSLLGASEAKYFDSDWEQISDNSVPGRLRHRGWRRHLRGGLYMYNSCTVYEGVTAAQLRAFQHDDEQRAEWDDSTLECEQLPSASPASQQASESKYLYCRTRFPKPLASREYVYARRVWPRQSDGGCYAVSRACAHAAKPGPTRRAVRVADFVSGYVIRAGPQGASPGPPAAQLVSFYFEDPQVRPGIINLAIKKGMWDAVKRNDNMLRRHLLLSAPRPGADAAGLPLLGRPEVTAFPLLLLTANDGGEVELDVERLEVERRGTLGGTASVPTGWLRSWYAPAAAVPARPAPVAPLEAVASFPLVMRECSIEGEEYLAGAATCAGAPEQAQPEGASPRKLSSHALGISSHALVLRRHALLLREMGQNVAMHGAETARHARTVLRAARAHGAVLRHRRHAARSEWVQRALKAVRVVAGIKLMHQVMNQQAMPRLSRQSQLL